MTLTDSEWNEMDSIRRAIKDYLPAVHPDKLERFTKLFVQTLLKEDFSQKDGPI